MKSPCKNSRSPFYTKLVLSIGLLICFPMLIMQILLFSTSYRTPNSQNDQYYFKC